MPPEGYTTITISEDLADKLTRIMASHDCSSYPDAIQYAVDNTLTQEDDITIRELIQILAQRVDDVDEGILQ
jgi:metal-responsive CopG/Arc/MetJ family transcriptional regulator